MLCDTVDGRYRMSKWLLAGEPSLDELLGDEMMHWVMRRAGLDGAELKRRLMELARRLGERSDAEPSCCCGTTVG
jgi:hypothetical protein